MTDKQIIIDGVDVSGCEHLYKEIDCLAHIDFSECCEGYNPSYGYCPNTDCYYKQLKAKEQECEELKEDEKSLLNVIDHLQKQKNEWEEKYNDLGQDFDQLKAKNIKISKTLTEIKEIAKQEIDSKEFMIVQCMLNGNVDNKNKVLKQILQEISECEVE